MMDEMYISMCREATEIQEGWKPKSGDCVGRKGTFQYDYIPKVGAGDNYAEDMTEFGVWVDGDYFIPRQEDLQEIYMAPYKGGLHVSTMVNSFYRWFWDEYNDKIKSCLEQYDWNEIWLCFVMYTRYNKKWNGKRWELIE